MSLYNQIDDTIGWIGNGAILMSKLDSNDVPVGGYWNCGQIETAQLSLSVEAVEMADTMSGTNGIAQRRVTKVTGEGTVGLKSFISKNMAAALFGSITKDAVGPKTQSSVANLGRIIVLDGIASAITSVTGTGATVYEEGVNYKVSSGSILILEDQPEEDGITEGEVLTIVYQAQAVERIEGFVNTDVNVRIVFEGKNLTTGQDVKVTWYKISLDPAAQRDLINSEYATLEIKGTLQQSKAITAVGMSKMFKEEYTVITSA